MKQTHHYTGLTDAQVLENRKKYGANILTPPEEETVWEKIKNCMHFWLLKVDLSIFVVTLLISVGLPLLGIYAHDGLWIAPVLSFVLFGLTYLVAYLGGDYDKKVVALVKSDEADKKSDEVKQKKVSTGDIKEGMTILDKKEKGFVVTKENKEDIEGGKLKSIKYIDVFGIDSLFTILLFALLLSGGIAFYNGVYGGESGITPYLELVGIAAAVLLATTVAHILEAQNEKTFQSLNEVNDDTLVKVYRNGHNVRQVPRKDIVKDDIIILEAGEEVPADAEILSCMNLIMNESSLTGEPQCMKTTNPDEFDENATYPSNHIMKGCTVMVGDCVAKVFAVGDSTACGEVFEAAQVRDGDATPLSKKLDELAGLITTTSYVLAILIVLGRLVRYAILDTNMEMGMLLLFLGGALVIADIAFTLLEKKKTEEYKDILVITYEKIKSLFDKKQEADEDEEDDDDDEEKGETLELLQVLAFMLLPIIGVFLYFALGTTAQVNWLGDGGIIPCALDSVMIAVTLIVVAVPEGLPMAVTLSLAFSMKRLMKQNTLPRTMHACETMGAVSVICSDKTGTLTQNQMKVVGSAFTGLDSQTLGTDKVSSLIKECFAINTTANLDMADPKKIKAIGNPTEGALLLWLHSNGVNYLDIRESLTVINRIQFTTELKYMATIVTSEVTGKRVVYVKGAPDILMDLCKITSDEAKFFNDKLADYQSHANRTLAFAYKELNDTDDIITDGKLNIKDLNMMGIVGIEDPVRTDVPAAIEDCLNAGIQVKIVTGDAPGTAKEIGRQLGLWKESDTDENILIGTELAAMSDDELKNRLPKVKIISRARPNDKERAVRILKELDYIVAVTGDGTNDAPALNAANVGLSMGDGTAVAKEASDMTIIDNSFSTIANAVMWGRSLYKNIKRFILFQMTVNVAACLIVFIGAFIGEESPLTVTQMLWVNLIMDTFAALALASLPPTKTVMNEKPRSVDEHILKGMGAGILGVGGIFTVILLGICIYFQHTDIISLMDVFDGTASWGTNNGLSAYELGLFFTIFVMLQFWNLFNAKAFMTSNSAFKGISWKETKWFIIIALVILVGQILMTEIPGLQEMFNVAEGGIKTIDWLIIIGSTSLVLWIGELVRMFSSSKK